MVPSRALDALQKTCVDAQSADRIGSSEHSLTFSLSVSDHPWLCVFSNPLDTTSLSSLRPMPDSFFAASKPRKRKRTTATQEHSASTSKKGRWAGGSKQTKEKQKSATAPTSKKKRDEELSDETQDDESAGGIDEMDLRAPDVDPNAYESGDEDEDETPAEKRLRLAKLYLDSVKQGMGLGAFHW